MAPGEIRSLVGEMKECLRHRGPDDSGELIAEACGIGMRRLAIIDVKGGKQPIASEDGRFNVVLSGEIYNYRELTDRLLQKGHRFSTSSDTETLVHLYEDEGKYSPRFLKGMFGFCIHDRQDGSLFLARDRFGEKPLFYYQAGDVFVFSSELRSLLQCNFIPRRLDQEALAYYLRVGFVPAPLTMFKDVRVLPPGHSLSWRQGKARVEQYYSVDYRPDPYLDREERAVEAVREALSRAVRRQAVSEVPLGAFLSGGIDSSAVVAMLQSVSSQPTKTFTVRFEESSYDESHIAREVANHLGTEHTEFVVPNLGFQEQDLWRIVDHVGAPFFDSSAIPTYILSKYNRVIR